MTSMNVVMEALPKSIEANKLIRRDLIAHALEAKGEWNVYFPNSDPVNFSFRIRYGLTNFGLSISNPPDQPYAYSVVALVHFVDVPQDNFEVMYDKSAGYEDVRMCANLTELETEILRMRKVCLLKEHAQQKQRLENLEVYLENLEKKK